MFSFLFRINNRTGWQNLSETFYLTRLLHCPFNASPAIEFIAHPITFSPTSSNTGPCQYFGEPAQQHFTWMWQTTPFKFFAFSYKIVVWQQETTLKCQHTFIASTGELKLREQQVAIQQKRNTTIPPSTTNNGHLLRSTANDGLFQLWFQIAIQIFYPFCEIGFQFHTRKKKTPQMLLITKLVTSEKSQPSNETCHDLRLSLRQTAQCTLKW